MARLATGSLDAYREYQEGLLAERRFLYEQAESHFRRAVELDSTFALAWLRLADRANTAQEAVFAYVKADQYKEKASERDRFMIEAMFAAELSGDLEEGQRLLQELIERYPDEKEARYQLGVFYDGQGRAEEGRRVIEEAVRLDPYFAPGINHLAYMAGRRGDEVGADTLSLRYLELEPGQANPHDSRAEILEMVGRHEEARAEFREALRIEPGFLASYEHLVRSYLRENDPRGARAALEPYMEVEDPDASVWVRRLQGDTYVAQGRYRDGLAAYRRAAERAAELGRGDLRLAPLLESAGFANVTGAYDEAEEAYYDADEIDPLNQNVLFGLLAVYGQQERIDEMLAVRDSAAARFDSAPSLIRDRAEILLRLADGIIAFYRDDAAAAVGLFDESRELAGAPRPNAFPGLGEESLALIEAGQASEALGLTKTLETISGAGNRFAPFPLHAALYLRGRAHEALGEQTLAAASYEKLLELAGDGVREAVFMRDTPERLARLRADAGA